MSESVPSEDQVRRRSLAVFFHENRSLLVQMAGLSLLLLLVVPFYMTALIALIVFAGIKQTARVVQKLPRTKKIIFYSVFYFALSCIVYLLSWFGNKIAETPLIFTKDNARQQIFTKFNSFFISNIESVERSIVKFIPSVDQSIVHEQFMQGMQNLFEFSFNWMLNFFSDLPMFILQFCFFITVVVWLAHSKSNEFRSFQVFVSRLASKSETKKFWAVVQGASYQTLISTFLVSLVQAGILGLTALSLNLPGWPIIFFIAFVFSFFPVVGTLPAAVLGIILAYNQEGAAAASIFIGAAVVTGFVDNFLRVWLMSFEGSVTPGSFNFFAIIGGIALFGFPGVLIGPFLLAFATHILREPEIK